MAKQQVKLAPVTSILNMKGGVGKTTIAAHLLREFYKKSEKNVLVIDLDPQFNLTQTVVNETKYEKLKLDQKTILSIMDAPEETSLYSTHDDEGTTPEPKDIIEQLKYLHPHGDAKTILAKLHLIPGDFSLCKYSLISDKKALSNAQKRFESFLKKAREEYDAVFIDCNPSSSFLTTCALKVSTHLLIPVRPDRYSMLGLRLLDKFVNEHDEIVSKPKKIIIINGIPRAKYDPTVENELRSDPEYGPVTLATALHITKLLEASPSYTGFATDRKVAYSKSLSTRLQRVSGELALALGVK